MLRRTICRFRAGDFLATIPTDAVASSLITLSSAPPPEPAEDDDPAEVEANKMSPAEKFARSLMDHFHSIANNSDVKTSSDTAIARIGLSPLSVQDSLLTSPLAELAGVPTRDHLKKMMMVTSSGGEHKNHPPMVAWCSPGNNSGSGAPTTRPSEGTIVGGWIGRGAATSTTTSTTSAHRHQQHHDEHTKVIAIVPSASPRGGGNFDGTVRMHEATIVTSHQGGASNDLVGHVVLKLGKQLAAADQEMKSSTKKSTTTSTADDDGDVVAARKRAQEIASTLLQAQTRLNHAAFTLAALRRICRDAVEVGTHVKFRNYRMSKAQCFHDAISAIGANEHMLVAAVQHTTMQIAESLFSSSSSADGSDLYSNKSNTEADGSGSNLNNDVYYDSGLLHVLSRSLLQNAMKESETLFLRHGPTPRQDQVDASSSSPSSSVMFKDYESWLPATQNVDMPFTLLCRKLGLLSDTQRVRNLLSQHQQHDGSSLGGGAAAELILKALPFLNRLRGGGGDQQSEGLFSDLHMNLSVKSQALLKDFAGLRKLAKTSSSFSFSNNVNDISNNNNNNNTSSLAEDEDVSSCYLIPVAAEIMGSTCMAYHVSNILEEAEDSKHSADLQKLMVHGKSISSEQTASWRRLPAELQHRNSTMKFASPTEASAVSWLAFEVALDESKNRRAALLRDAAAYAEATGKRSVADAPSTHPMTLKHTAPADDGKKKTQADEDDEVMKKA